MTRTLQPLSIKGLRSKFAAALEIKETKVGIELAADDPVILTASTWYPAPLTGKPIRELQILAETLGFRLSIVPTEQKLVHLQRAVSRKKKGSKNRQKAVRKLARWHAYIAHIRDNILHGISTAIAKRFGTVGMEDLNVGGMGRNRTLAKALHDAALAELRRQVEYKVVWKGGRVILADRFYPSSKKCSRCGLVKAELPLSERTFQCDECGLVLDRDENAARNLKAVAASGTETLNACGGDVRPRVGRQTPAKQEPNAISDSVLNG